MTWTVDEQRAVGTALLGSWPGTITAWGKDAFAAYLAELEARGLAAGAVLVAVRSWPAGSDFPPSAPNLAAAARTDPGVPTFDEMYALIYGRGGVLRAQPPYGGGPMLNAEAKRDEAAWARAADMHPAIGELMRRYGLRRLRMLEVDGPFGDLKRKELRQAWTEMLETSERREVAVIAAGRERGRLGSFDPLAALGVPADRAQIEAGES